MIDRDPVETRAQIGFHLLGKVAGELFKIGQFACVLGRDDEPEMVPVVLAPVGESEIVRAIGAGIEHHALLAVPADAFTLEVG